MLTLNFGNSLMLFPGHCWGAVWHHHMLVSLIPYMLNILKGNLDQRGG